MATLIVGPGQQFMTIEGAVQASSPGDTIDVQAGTYNDDFLGIYQDLTLQAVGGPVVMTEDTSPPNGKAMIDEGGPGVSVTINGFDISGVSVGDSNGAAVRYEGGNLALNQDYFHDNQEGLLAAADPNGTITIDDSQFADNGDGSGFTHNIYVNQLATLTVENSLIEDASVGHDIKSRAADTIITNNTISDVSGSASYEIDLPNGGNATVTGNTIEKGPNAQNPYMIAYGEEGQSNPGTAVDISDNTFVNDFSSPNVAVVFNPTGTALGFTDNSVYGTSQLVAGGGSLDASGTVFLGSRPSVDTSAPSFAYPSASGSGVSSAGSDGGGSAGSVASDNGSGSGSGGSSAPPQQSSPDPIQPTASLPLIDAPVWQNEVINDFVNWFNASAANQAQFLADEPNQTAALWQEINDPLTGSQGIPADAPWGPFPS